MYVLSVPFGGLLLGNGSSQGADFFTHCRTGATICRIKIWCTCGVWFARGSCIFAAFWPRPRPETLHVICAQIVRCRF